MDGWMHWKILAQVDGGPSGGSRVRRPGSEDPHRRELIFKYFPRLKLSLYTDHGLPMYPGSGKKVCLVGGGV